MYSSLKAVTFTLFTFIAPILSQGYPPFLITQFSYGWNDERTFFLDLHVEDTSPKAPIPNQTICHWEAIDKNNLPSEWHDCHNLGDSKPGETNSWAAALTSPGLGEYSWGIKHSYVDLR
jgi:hypothetical protein